MIVKPTSTLDSFTIIADFAQYSGRKKSAFKGIERSEFATMQVRLYWYSGPNS